MDEAKFKKTLKVSLKEGESALSVEQDETIRLTVSQLTMTMKVTPMPEKVASFPENKANDTTDWKKTRFVLAGAFLVLGLILILLSRFQFLK